MHKDLEMILQECADDRTGIGKIRIRKGGVVYFPKLNKESMTFYFQKASAQQMEELNRDEEGVR